MSQHIVGNMANTVQTDFGEFITISGKRGIWRVRKNQVLSYCAFDQSSDPDIKEKDHYVLALNIAGMPQGVGIPFSSSEELKTAAEKLDWIYKKDEARD